jgi:hypothetical protein
MDALVGYAKRRRPLARRVLKSAEMLQRLCGIERVTAPHVRDLCWRDWSGSRGSLTRGIRRALATDVRVVRSASLSATPTEPKAGVA